MVNTKIKVLLCAPRGFCAGVDRAIQIVELALEKYGPPVYVRHEIVHNRFVVDSLRAKGAVFVEELEEIPETNAPVIFSAHGVAKSVPEAAKARNMFFVDATCPLVSKVHKGAERAYRRGHHMILIGHEGHPEVIGTMGQLPNGASTLVETVEDVAKLDFAPDIALAYNTQTTLSVDDTADIVAALTKRFRHIQGPSSEDICYATTNRQEAVKHVAPMVDAMLVVGAPNSSNSMRLVEVAKKAGCPKAQLVRRAIDIDWQMLDSVKTIGLTAGASAPEQLVEEIIAAIAEKAEVCVETVRVAEETVVFNIPRILRDAEASHPQNNQPQAIQSAE